MKICCDANEKLCLLLLYMLTRFIYLCFIYIHIAYCNAAGENASFSDGAYVEAGAIVLPGSEQIVAQADVITKIRPPDMTNGELEKLAGKTLVGMVSPAINTDLYDALAAQNTNVFALDCVPRMLSRAQTYDVLSSQANIAGYRAVVEAAEEFPRFFAGQMTAAGKVPPAKVLVLGAGVAGLAAIQTAKNMGAIVRAFDVRPVCKEQVESMGATFLEVDIEEDGSGSGGYAKEMSDEFKTAQAQLMLEQASDVDIIITTALIPGRKAPILVNQAMLSVMDPGSVVVDLAAANGGNAEQTKPDEIVTTSNGVKIIGYTDLPSRLAATASNLVSSSPLHSPLFLFLCRLIENVHGIILTYLRPSSPSICPPLNSLAIMSRNSSCLLAPRQRERRESFRLIWRMMPSKTC